jgi:hypothetical protein
MIKWDYKTVATEKNFRHAGNYDGGERDEQNADKGIFDQRDLKKLGRDGWELVSIVESDSYPLLIWVFKRIDETP